MNLQKVLLKIEKELVVVQVLAVVVHQHVVIKVPVHAQVQAAK
jgi:hypothetical protein